MPLVDHYNYLLVLTSVNDFENVFVSFVNKDLFEFGEIYVSALDIPVNEMLI